MRLFIYELISAGGLGADVPLSLRQEGAAMLRAIVEDFERVSGVHVLTLLAGYSTNLIGQHCRRIAAADEPRAFRDLAADADAALIIAPEFEDLLERRTDWASIAECQNLGCTENAIRLTRNKYRLASWLSHRGIPTLSTRRLSSVSPAVNPFPCVLKPRDGAGSQATFLIPVVDDWSAVLKQARAEYPSGAWIVQPFHPGQPVSVAFLVGPNQIVPTPGATQRLSDDGRFRYLGGTTPLAAHFRARAVALAKRAVESIPGLQGYVGVDLILGETDDGRQDVVVEINPRLTTSFIGLRQLTRTNLADLWLRLWRGETVEMPDWSNEAIDFAADGTTWLAKCS